jgi:hypothetical protein
MRNLVILVLLNFAAAFPMIAMQREIPVAEFVESFSESVNLGSEISMKGDENNFNNYVGAIRKSPHINEVLLIFFSQTHMDELIGPIKALEAHENIIQFAIQGRRNEQKITTRLAGALAKFLDDKKPNKFELRDVIINAKIAKILADALQKNENIKTIIYASTLSKEAVEIFDDVSRDHNRVITLIDNYIS